MRKIIFTASLLLALAITAKAQRATVYFTKDISAESLVVIYKALGVEAEGRVALKREVQPLASGFHQAIGG